MGGVILLLVAVVLILALRSPEVHLAPWQQGLWTRITGLACVALLLVLSAGVVVFHATNAAPTVVPAGSRPRVATALPQGGSSPQPAVMASPTPFPSPSPSPTPFPRLVPGPSQVLTTFCHAIDHHDLKTAWGQYAEVLQKERATPPPFLFRLTIVHCRLDQVSENSATGGV